VNRVAASRKRAKSVRTPASAWSGKVWAGVLSGAFLGSLVLFYALLSQLPQAGAGHVIAVKVDDSNDVASQLANAGVVKDPSLFRWYLWLAGASRSMRAGDHLIADDLSYSDIVARLSRSSHAQAKVVLPEGLARFEMATRLMDAGICSSDSFLAATNDPTLLEELNIPFSEGFLFPATYELPVDSDAKDIVRRLVADAKNRFGKLSKGSDVVDRLPRKWVDVFVLASIVEKEASVDDERPIIASVFENRLFEPEKTDGKLQADPTAAYGCRALMPPPASCAPILSGQTRMSAEIQHDSANAFSTYVHAGLPPTAISNPGEASLKAVLFPAKTRFFFFVGKGGGRHTFSEDLAAHQQAVHANKPPH
jgi:UPF0755 protein